MFRQQCFSRQYAQQYYFSDKFVGTTNDGKGLIDKKKKPNVIKVDWTIN